MLVTFKTSAYSDITLFGEAAVPLLKMMGQSGNVPGAIMADDLPEAISSLEQALQKLSAQPGDYQQNEIADSSFDEDDSAASIGLDKRAGPLLSLLKAAADAGENVLWDQ